MLPSSWIALAVLLALVPGYFYLRLTEGNRHPRDATALGEFLEVLAVGLCATGGSAIVLLLTFPGWVRSVLVMSPVASAGSLRSATALGLCVIGAAVAFAGAGARLMRRVSGETFKPSVWRSTLGMRRAGHVPYVYLDLATEGRRVAGTLHAFTTLDGDQPRDLALLNPVIHEGGQSWRADADFVIVSASEIRKIWMKLQPDPGASDAHSVS